MKTVKYHIYPEDIKQPEWKDLVERWYQLDQSSLVLCQAIYSWSLAETNLKNIEAIIYLFDHGSNVADRDFTQYRDNGSAASPSKFVYTLPNIPIMVVQQMLKISVPTFCVDQKMSVSLISLLKCMSHQFKNILVVKITVQHIANKKTLWKVYGDLVLNENIPEVLQCAEVEV